MSVWEGSGVTLDFEWFYRGCDLLAVLAGG